MSTRRECVLFSARPQLTDTERERLADGSTLPVPQEIAEGKAMIDAAIAAGVDLFIFSSLPSPSKWSGGKYTQVHHCESDLFSFGRLPSHRS
jgi:hypothetical protein